MPDEIDLLCWVHGDSVDHSFQVTIERSANVADLKNAILLERKQSFQLMDPDSLQIRKFQLCLETFDYDAAQHVKFEDGQDLKCWKPLSDYWKQQPAGTVLSVIILHPARSKSEWFLPGSRPPWLVEIHKKLWGRRDLFNQIFRTAILTETDFIELQHRLQSHNPERNSDFYVAEDVLAIKSEFLRSRSFTSSNTATAHFDAGSNCDLVPQLVFDTSRHLNPPIVSADVVDDDAMNADAIDIDLDPDLGSHLYINADAVHLSKGTTAIFPCTIRYMDLTVLKLENFIRTPLLVLIRNEWSDVVDIFNRREKGIQGSAVFTGQPGTGKTCLLYYILILCIIRAQPIVFQDMMGDVFLINDKVRHRKGRINVPGDDVLMLVDADGKLCTPGPYPLDAFNLRILLISPPRSRRKRKWLPQYVGEIWAVHVMKPWSREELLVASSVYSLDQINPPAHTIHRLFLAGIDITLKLFQETTRICGHIPRQCLKAAVSPDMLSDATDVILSAIKETEIFVGAFFTDEGMHRALEICPSPESRCRCLAQPVSDWAFSEIMAELDRRGGDAAYDFYRRIQESSDSVVLCGKIFETKVHKFFQSITKPRSFTIHSLDNYSTTFEIEFSSSTTHHTFGADQRSAGQLASSVNSSKSCYLKPLSDIFPTFDSFLYLHEMSQSGCQPLLGFQITAVNDHPISVKGLAAVQTCLKPKVPELKALRPTKTTKWIILFVVPEDMAVSFVKQKFKDAQNCGKWHLKTAQYVLELPMQEVMRS